MVQIALFPDLVPLCCQFCGRKLATASLAGLCNECLRLDKADEWLDLAAIASMFAVGPFLND